MAVGRIMASRDQNVYVLLPGTCVHIPYMVKRDFADVIRDLEMGMILDYLGDPDVVTGYS